MKAAALILAEVAGLIGLIVLIGWIAGNVELIAWQAGKAPLQFNAALCMILAAATTSLLFTPHARLLKIASYLLAAVAGYTLLEYTGMAPYSINNLFIDHWYAAHTPVPGRMAPHLALVYLASASFGLLCCYKPPLTTQLVLLSMLAGGALVLAGAVLLGYLNDLGTLTTAIGSATAMAFPAAVGTTCLAASKLVYILYLARLYDRRLI